MDACSTLIFIHLLCSIVDVGVEFFSFRHLLMQLLAERVWGRVILVAPIFSGDDAAGPKEPVPAWFVHLWASIHGPALRGLGLTDKIIMYRVFEKSDAQYSLNFFFAKLSTFWAQKTLLPNVDFLLWSSGKGQGLVNFWCYSFSYTAALNLPLNSVNTLILLWIACLHISLVHKSPATCSHFCLCVTSLKSYKTISWCILQSSTTKYLVGKWELFCPIE